MLSLFAVLAVLLSSNPNEVASDDGAPKVEFEYAMVRDADFIIR
jgi:hypothetical protein